MKIYVGLDDSRNISAISTIRTPETPNELNTEALEKLEKLEGFYITAGMLEYSDELYESKLTEKAEAEAIKQAQEELETIKRQEVLDQLNDDHALAVKALFPKWKAGRHYKTGQRIQYEDKLFKILQDHDSQESWKPTDAPSLFKEIV